MGIKVADFFAEFGFQFDPKGVQVLDTELEKGRSKLSKFAAGVLSLDAVTNLISKGFHVVKGVIGAVTSEIGHAGDEIADTAKKIGVGTDSLQRLRFAADKSGTPIEALTTGLVKLTRGMEEARTQGAGPFHDALAKLGVPLSELEGKSAEEQMGILADALQRVEDPARRTALTVELFGKSGFQLGSTLAEGSKGIKALGDEAEKLGHVLSADTIKKAAEWDDKQKELEASIRGVKAAIAGALLPVITEATGSVAEWISANRELIATKVKEFVEAAVPAIRDFVAFVRELIGHVNTLVTSLGGLGPALTIAATAFVALKAAAGGIPNLFAGVLAASAALGAGIVEHFTGVMQAAQATQAEADRLQKETLATNARIAALKETDEKKRAEIIAKIQDDERKDRAARGAGIDFDNLTGSQQGTTERGVKASARKFIETAGEKAAKTARARGASKVQVEEERVKAQKFARQAFDERRFAIEQEASKLSRAGANEKDVAKFALGKLKEIKVFGQEDKKGGTDNAIEAEIKRQGEEASEVALKAALEKKLSSKDALAAALRARKAKEKELRADPSKVFSTLNAFSEEIKQRIETGASEYAARAMDRALLRGESFTRAVEIADVAKKKRKAELEASPEALAKDKDLISQLTGGRLTSDKFGTGSSPGFGAQVVRFDVKVDNTFQIDIDIDNKDGSLGPQEILDRIQGKIVQEFTRINRETMRDVLPEVER